MEVVWGVDVSVGVLLVELSVVLLLDGLCVVLSEVELVLEEVEEAWLVEGLDVWFVELEVVEGGWFAELVEGFDGLEVELDVLSDELVEEVDEWIDELVEVEVDGLELELWVGMAPSPLACHLPQFSG